MSTFKYVPFSSLLNTFWFLLFLLILVLSTITFHNLCYFLWQVGKGRDVGLNQIALFEGKVAGGNGEQVLSRDVYRIGQLFDFFRMMSFYFTTVGFYVCTMVRSTLSFMSCLKFSENMVHESSLWLMQMTVLTVYFFLYGIVYLVSSYLFYLPFSSYMLNLLEY